MTFRIFIIAVMILLNLTMVAYSHSWYEYECCSGKDCQEVLNIEQDPNSTDQYWTVRNRDNNDVLNDNLFKLKVTEKERLTKGRTSIDEKVHICFDHYMLNNEEYIYIKCIYFPGAV